MGIEDIFAVFEEISVTFEIPLWLITLFVFLSGYITVRLLIKNMIIEKLDAIDDIFLISVIGLVWFARLYFIYIFMISISRVLSRSNFLYDLLLGILISLSVFFFISIDLGNIGINFRIKYFKRSFLMNKKSEKFVVFIFSLIVIITFGYLIFYTGFSTRGGLLFFMCVLCFSPMIYLLVGFVKKILPKERSV